VSCSQIHILNGTSNAGKFTSDCNHPIIVVECRNGSAGGIQQFPEISTQTSPSQQATALFTADWGQDSKCAWDFLLKEKLILQESACSFIYCSSIIHWSLPVFSSILVMPTWTDLEIASLLLYQIHHLSTSVICSLLRKNHPSCPLRREDAIWSKSANLRRNESVDNREGGFDIPKAWILLNDIMTRNGITTLQLVANLTENELSLGKSITKAFDMYAKYFQSSWGPLRMIWINCELSFRMKSHKLDVRCLKRTSVKASRHINGCISI
jgi:hypothetical protein